MFHYATNLRLIRFRPKLLWRLLVNYLHMIVFRSLRLRTITFALDYNCQCACQHCSAEAMPDNATSLLTVEEYARIIREAYTCGVVNVHFTGGEPLLSEKLYDVVSQVDTGSVIVSLATNGIDLAQHAERLRQVGIDLVIVSIDSSFPDQHDTWRAYPGAFAAAWKGIEAAKKAGLQVMVAMVATPENLFNGDIDRQIARCRSNDMLLQLLPVRSIGSWEGRRALHTDKKAQQRYIQYVNQPGVRWDGEANYFGASCLAARQRIYVSPTGSVMPCDFIPRSYGNVRADSLLTIWRRMVSEFPFSTRSQICRSAFDQNFMDWLNKQHQHERSSDPNNV